MISKADNFSSIFALYHDDYYEKIDKFISKNNFAVANSDITKQL